MLICIAFCKSFLLLANLKFFKIFWDLELGGDPLNPQGIRGPLGLLVFNISLSCLRCVAGKFSWASSPLVLGNYPNFKNLRGLEASKIFPKTFQKLKLIEFIITWDLGANVHLGSQVNFN